MAADKPRFALRCVTSACVSWDWLGEQLADLLTTVVKSIVRDSDRPVSETRADWVLEPCEGVDLRTVQDLLAQAAQQLDADVTFKVRDLAIDPDKDHDLDLVPPPLALSTRVECRYLNTQEYYLGTVVACLRRGFCTHRL